MYRLTKNTPSFPCLPSCPQDNLIEVDNWPYLILSGAYCIFRQNGRFLHPLTTLTIPLFLSSFVVLLIISPYFLLQQYAKLPLTLTTSPNANALNWPSPPPTTSIASLPQKRPHPPSNPKPCPTAHLQLKVAYTPAELRHLLDVKHLTDTIRLINLVSLLFLLSILASFSRLPLTSFRPALYRAIGYGGLLTVLSFLTLLLFVALLWSVFFVQFHELLFPPGTWTFSSTSGLIRLYPELFWYRVGLGIVGRIVVLGIVTTITGLYLARRAEQKPPSPHPILPLPFNLDQVDAWGNQRIATLAKRSGLVVLLAALLFFSLRTHPFPFSLLTLPFVAFFSFPVFQAIKQDIYALFRYYHIQLGSRKHNGRVGSIYRYNPAFRPPLPYQPRWVGVQGLLVALLLLFVYWVATIAVPIHRYRYPQTCPQE